MRMMKRLRLALLLAGVLVIGLGLVLIMVPRPAQAEGQSTTALSNENCDAQETSFGDLATDALRDASKANIAFIAAISFIKAGSLAPGPLSRDRIASMLTNPDEVWAVSELSGAQVRDTLERSVHSAPLPSTSFLQVSGVTFQYDPTAPRGERIASVLVGLDPLLPCRHAALAGEGRVGLLQDLHGQADQGAEPTGPGRDDCRVRPEEGHCVPDGVWADLCA